MFVNFLKAEVRRAPASDPSDGTGEVLHTLIENLDLTELLTYFLNAFKIMPLPDDLRPYLLPMDLLGIKKK